MLAATLFYKNKPNRPKKYGNCCCNPSAAVLYCDNCIEMIVIRERGNSRIGVC